MPVVYHCPHCRQPVTVPDQMIGQVIGCPHCRNAFQALSTQPPAPPPPPVESPPEPKGAFDNLEDDSPSRGRSRNGPSRDRRDQPQSSTLAHRLAVTAATIGAGIVLGVYRSQRGPTAGFDVTEVFVAMFAGGICAGLGYAIGAAFDSPKKAPPPRRRRRRRDDDYDD